MHKSMQVGLMQPQGGMSFKFLTTLKRLAEELSITVDNSEHKSEHLEFQTNSMSSKRQLRKDTIYKCLCTKVRTLKNKKSEPECMALNGDFNITGI